MSWLAVAFGLPEKVVECLVVSAAEEEVAAAMPIRQVLQEADSVGDVVRQVVLLLPATPRPGASQASWTVEILRRHEADVEQRHRSRSKGVRVAPDVSGADDSGGWAILYGEWAWIQRPTTKA
jgi:hypothetical protein